MAPELGHLLDSLGWAIIHSLWQGALAAIAVVLFRNLTSEKNAALRYAVQVTALVSCFLAFLVTLGLYLGSPHTVDVSLIRGSAVEPFTAIFSSIGATEPESVSKGIPASLTAYTPLLGILWCIGFALLAVRYCGAFILTQHLRHTGLSPVPNIWVKRFETLVCNAGIRQNVSLFISDRVSGPLTLGFFKPVVLVPASFFVGLPSAQIEAILLHEIAHIRRHDYMINLLQTAIKTIFFFHPAVHYISRKIDHDREHACDDFAVALTKDPRSLAKGLAALRLNLPPNAFALAADNGNTPLVARLKRLGRTSETPRRPEHVLTSAAALILAAGLYVNTSPLANADPAPHKVRDPELASNIAHPTGDKGNYTFEQITKNDTTFTAKIAPDGSRWILVDGMWYDVDRRPEMIARIPETPMAPTPPTKVRDASESFMPQYGQYKVDLDYYIASLEHAQRGTSELARAAPDTTSETLAKKLAKAEKTRDKIRLLVDEALQRNRKEKQQVWDDAQNTLKSGVHIDGESVDAPDSRIWIKQFEKEMTRIALAQARGEMSEDAADHARERAGDALDAHIDRAEEQHEREMEAMERAEEARVRAEEQRIRHEEQRERAIELAEAERERVEAEAERALEQAERERERAEKERERAEKIRERAKDYQKFSQALMKQLKKDGLIEAGATSVMITYPNKKMTVNGVRVPRDLEDNYCGFLEKYDIRKYDGTRIQIKPESFEYKSHAQDGLSTRHIHQDFGPQKKASVETSRVRPLHLENTDWAPDHLERPITKISTDWTSPTTDVSEKSLTFAHPTSESWISLSYAEANPTGKRHNGIDLAAPNRTPIIASADGIVTHAKAKGKWGNLITITHKGGYETHYAHLGDICVAEGDQVSQGDNIGTVGSTGVSSGPHLHFEIRHNGQTLNPQDLIQDLIQGT